jgi:hypothetical protein
MEQFYRQTIQAGGINPTASEATSTSTEKTAAAVSVSFPAQTNGRSGNEPKATKPSAKVIDLDSLLWRLEALGIPFEKAFELDHLVQDIIKNTRLLVSYAPERLHIFSSRKVSMSLYDAHWDNAQPFIKQIHERLKELLGQNRYFEVPYQDNPKAKQYKATFQKLGQRLLELRAFEMTVDTAAIEYLRVVVRLECVARNLLEPDEWADID